MDRRLDPRSIVTPYAFAVHPDLLGMPLATPWQRLGAILVDLIVIGFISLLGVVPLAIGSTALLFWLASRKPGRDVFGKVFRIAVGCLGFLVLTVTLLVVLFIRYGDDLEQIAEEMGNDLQIDTWVVPGTGDPEESGGEVGILDIFQGFRGIAALRDADSPEDAQALMTDFARGAFDAKLPRSQIRDLLGELLPEDAPWASDAEEMVDEAMRSLAAPTVEGNEASIAPEEAVTGEPSEAFGPAAMDSIDHLNRAIQVAQEDRAAAAAGQRSAQRL